MRFTCPVTGHDWQTPVVTEKLAADLLEKIATESDHTYLAVPWASIIDRKNSSRDEYRIAARKTLNQLKELPKQQYVTVCQHYRYKELLDDMVEIGVKYLYTPHACVNIKHDNVSIQPFPLFATNPVKASAKTIRYSFIGAYMDHYISDIRNKIFEYNHTSDDTIIIQRDRWQYNDEVYMKQVWEQELPRMSTYISDQKSKHYKYILSKSRYSLCPSGAGPNSIRIFESLSCGAIPIIFADGLELPHIKEVNWSDCVIHIPEKDFNNFEEIIKNISPAVENQMREKCIEAYRYVSDENFIRCVIQKIK